MSATPPADLRYTVEHEWLREGSPATVGITHVAADTLGDIVYVELPQVGAQITAGAVIGEIESTKTMAELYSPVSGTVVEINHNAVNDPAVVNADPYGEGWLIRVQVSAAGDLLDAEAYSQLS